MSKRAIVTGASGGIGKAVANALNKEADYGVYALDSKILDVTDEKRITEFFKNIEEKEIEVLVNCAGTSHLGGVYDTDISKIMEVMDVNLYGTIRMCRAVMPYMMAQNSGYIINLGSLRGIEFCEGKSAYSVSKAGVRAFSHVLALEMQKYDVKVTCINPGFVFTDLIQHRILEENLQPTDIIQPKDIAKTVLFLLNLSEGVQIPEINMGSVWE